jgi:surface antigen
MSDTPDKKIPDEPMDPNNIMPFADGVADPEQRAAALAALAKEPAPMDEYESYEFTRAGGPMARVFDEVLAAPVPERLLATLQGSAAAPTRTGGASLPGRPFWERIGDLLRLPAFSPALAIPALAIAAAAGWFASTALHPDLAPLEKRDYVASALQKALEQTPNSHVVKLADGVSLKPTFTFAGAQSWCRQYELDRETGLQSQGIACRISDGTWRVITATDAEPAPTPSKPGQIEPAGLVDPLEEVRGTIKRGDVLGSDAVQRLIKDGWPAKPGN